MSTSNKFNNLEIKNYVISKKDSADDIMIIHGFSKDILKENDAIRINHNKIIKTKCQNNKLFYKDLNKNDPPLIEIGDSKSDDNEGKEKLFNSIKKYGIGEAIIMNKNSNFIEKNSNHRIYDSLIFVNENFFNSQEELNDENFFNIYENSLFNYCMQYNKEIISYTVRENERNEIEFFFEVNSPVNKNSTIGDLLSYNLTEYLKFFNIPNISTPELSRRVKRFFKNDSVLMKNLTNFWISFIFSKLFKKYEDIELLVFHFGEKLFPIDIKEI